MTVDEIGEGGTSLGDYSSSVECTGDGLTTQNGTTSASFDIPAGDGAITCTFTNTFGEVLPPPEGTGIIICGDASFEIPAGDVANPEYLHQHLRGRLVVLEGVGIIDPSWAPSRLWCGPRALRSWWATSY